MKATYTTLKTDLTNFDRLKYQYENEPGKQHGLNKKEIARRIALIDDIKDLIENQLEQEYRAVENNQAALAA